MNLLTDTLPDFLIIDGKEYKIKTDFKIWIKVSQIMSDTTFSAENIIKIIGMVFEEIPTNLCKTIQEIFKFSNPLNRKGGKDKEETTTRRIFDYEYDSEYIYAAFWQQYNIDLCKADLHWWQFLALFNCLSEETVFSKVIQYRCVDLKDIKDKEMRKHYRKMKGIYALSDNRTQEEKEQDFNERIAELF